jgi:hypothetical protein
MFNYDSAFRKDFKYASIYMYDDTSVCEYNHKTKKISKKIYGKILKNFNLLLTNKNNLYKLSYKNCKVILLINIENILNIEDNIENNITYPNSCSIIFSDNTSLTIYDNSFDVLKPIIRNKKIEKLIF